MLIVALVLAVIGLAALVTAVVTSNELIAWVCIGASVIGVVLLIVDALRERSRRDAGESPAEQYEPDPYTVEDYPEEASVAEESHESEEPEESHESEEPGEPAVESDAETTVNKKLEDQTADEDSTNR
jgi:flagellar biosynthesis/type III secretory pathway M-ring protein FliF/YscJ